MKCKIAAVGDLETITGFGLAGVTHLHLHRERAETLEKIKALLSDPEVGLILLTARVKEELSEELGELLKFKGPLPMVLTIPDKEGYYPPAVDELERLVRRTAGVEVVLG